MTHGGSFLEIAAILALATLLGLIGLRLRQPLIIMFLATGILAGPSALGLIQSYEQIALLAQVGIALLLFIVGLKLDLHLIRTIGPVALTTGLGQIAFTAALGYAIARAMDLAPLAAVYVAVALTFSSTIIIVKLLSDKREIDSLSGRIALGLLIVQDIAAILALVVLTSFGAPLDGGSAAGLALSILARGGGLVAGVALLMRYAIPWLLRHLSRSQEHLTIFAVSWAVILGAGSELLGFSKEVGAFLAGVSLASTEYRDAIGARLTTLRDFLLLFFFIELGARLDWGEVGHQAGRAALLSLFVLLAKPLIVLVVMGTMGYRRRTSFQTGLSMAQISEFSLIVAALGLSLGHIGPQTMGLITLVGVITIFVSAYLILNSARLYALLSGALRIFERRHPYREAAVDSAAAAEPAVDVVLVGLGNYGSGVAEHLLHRGRRVVGVDFDPDALRKWRGRGLPVIYGDVGDPEIHEQLPLDRARWVASTVRDRDLSLTLLNLLKHRGFAGRLALAASNGEEARRFEQAGAHVVFRPFRDASEQAADSLTYAMDLLPESVDWPLAFREVRIQSGSAFVGQTLRGLALRAATGVSILAVSRAGHVHYDPGPDFQLYPGDRVVLIGAAEDLRAAEEMLGRRQAPPGAPGPNGFEMAELAVGSGSPLAGRSLGDLEFRQRYSVTVVGIRRDREQIVTPGPAVRLEPGDVLVVIGAAEAVSALRQRQPL